MSKTCKKCGTVNDDKAKRCTNCNAKFHKAWYKRWYIWFFTAILTIILFACVTSNNGTTTTPTGATSTPVSTVASTEIAPTPTTPAPTAYGINDTFANKTVSGKVTSVTYSETADNILITVPDGAKVMTVTIEVTNISDKDNYVSMSDFRCYADNLAVDCELLGSTKYNENLSAGRAVVLSGIYFVPENAEVIELEYCPIGESSKNKIVIKLK